MYGAGLHRGSSARGVAVLLGAVCLLFALAGWGDVKTGDDENLIVGKQQFVA